MRVGWIGLGRMGREMALRVLAGGHELIAHSREFGRHDDVARAGGRLVATAAEAARDVDLLCVNVFSGDQLMDALVDAGGLAALPPGAVLAVHSTVSPALIAELAARRADVDIVDAGFSGIDEDARVGRLTLMVGGRAEAVERAAPAFKCYADTITQVGPSGAGMTIKIINNVLFAAQVSLAYEALGVATANGIAVADAVAVLQSGSAASAAMGNYARFSTPSDLIERIGEYMKKDVAIGLDSFPSLDEIRSATRRFVS